MPTREQAIIAIRGALDEGHASGRLCAENIEYFLHTLGVLTYEPAQAPASSAMTVELRLDTSAFAAKLRRIADASDQE